MTDNQSSRLDRIEAAIEADRKVNQQRFEQIQQWYDNERQLIAEFRTQQTIQSQQLVELRRTAELLLQTVQLHQDDINIIAQSIRQHRSDGHGA
jgi:hypothetical protein